MKQLYNSIQILMSFINTEDLYTFIKLQIKHGEAHSFKRGIDKF